MSEYNRQSLVQPSRRYSSSSLSNDKFSRRHKPDYLLLILALILCVIGLIVVYAISPGLAITKNVNQNYFVIKQMISIGLGLVAFIVFSILSHDILKKLKNVLVVMSVISVIVVEVLSDGKSRWIQVAGLSFQVAELVKLTLIVWLADFMVARHKNNEIDDFNKTFRPLLIVLGILGVVVAMIESDLGSTGVMMAIMAVMSFIAGLPLKKIGIILAVISIGTILAVSSTPYRRQRISTFLNPTADCQASGYQACQALIAVGSGGLAGKGLGNSVQAYGYLPEAANDSIFAIFAEKFGFIGSAIVLGIYLVFFARLRRIIERTSDFYSRLFVVGFLAWLSTQTIINVGAMIGILPLKGITLPFISYGGTSILFIMAALGVVFHISRYTNFESVRSVNTNKGDNLNEKNRTVRRGVGRPYYSSTRSR